MESKNNFNQSTNKDKIKDNEIKENISPNSTCEEVSKFFENYLNFKGNVNITGEMLFKLRENDIKELGRKLGMKFRQITKLIIYINKLKLKKEKDEEYDIDITSKSSCEEVSKFLREKLHFSQEIIDELGLDGECLFDLEYEDIQDFDENTTKSLKKFIEKRKKIDITENKDNKILNKIKSKEEKEEKDEINADSENKNKNDYNIQSLSGLSKYNVFIVIALKKDSYHNIKISFFSDDFLFDKLETLKHNILNETTFKNLYELFLIQIEFGDITNNLIMRITNNKKEELDEQLYLTGIKNINNYFYFDNFPEQNKILINIPMNILFNEFYNYFFDKKSNFDEKYKKDFIRSLIYSESNIRISGNNILKIMKLCLKYKLELNKIIKYIIFVINSDSLEDENLLTFNEIDNLFSNSIVIKLILEIYIFQLKQKEILVEIIFTSKYQKEISKTLLNLLKEEIIEPKDLFFFQNFDMKRFQLLLLEKISYKREIRYIIDISQYLEKALEFIATNYIKIKEKIKSLTSFYEKEFKIDLSNLKIGDNLLLVLDLLRKIFNISSENSYHLINYEKLFKLLDDNFFPKNLEVYCQLNDFISLTEKYLNSQIIIEFYDKVHKKGMEMIKNNQMKEEKIFIYITNMDKYYFSPKFNKSEKKDPGIMKYIPLTDISPNYLKNIELMKKYKIINCFLNSRMENRFYITILEQVKKILDLKFIFDIFPLKEIKNSNFTLLINQKINNIKYTMLDVNSEKYNDLFNIFDNLLLINTTNTNQIINELFVNLMISNKYFVYLFNKKTVVNDFIMVNVIDSIIKLNRENKSHDLFTDIILNTKDKYTKYILEKINDLCINENDFYKKEKSPEFIFYSIFINKCQKLYKNFEDIKGTYPNSIKLLNNKILEDLKNGNIKFELLGSSLSEGQSFVDKINLLTSEKNESKLLYEKLKNNFEHCQKDFSSIEIIIEYYSTFFSNSKEDLIKEIKEKQKEYKEEKNINELINMDIKNFFNIKNFYLNEAIEEAKNIKYKYSNYFMIIYKNHYEKYNLEKSEEKILKESINDYINIIKYIIEKLEMKLSLFEINNIGLIIKESLNPGFNLDKEIDFIKKEFSFLNKNEYINNNLKNDLIIFIEQFQFVKLIQGIIKFIKYN